MNEIVESWMRLQPWSQSQLDLAAGYIGHAVCGAVIGQGSSMEQVLHTELFRTPMRFAYPALFQPDSIRIGADSVTVSASSAHAKVVWAEGEGSVLQPKNTDEKTFSEKLSGLMSLSGQSQVKGNETGLRLDCGGDHSRRPISAICEDFLHNDPSIVGDDSYSLLLLKSNRILFEKNGSKGGTDKRHKLWSISKAVTALAVGAGNRSGAIDIDHVGFAEILEDPSDRERAKAMTFRNLIGMTSGLRQFDRLRDADAIQYGGMPIVEYVSRATHIANPGAICQYSNIDVLLMSWALRNQLGQKKYHSFLFDHLIAPLGMSNTFAEKNIDGDYLLSTQIWSTGRDLARLGCLCLNVDGLADQMLPRGWLEFLQSPGPTPPKPDGQFDDFGGQFWLPGRQHGLPARTMYSMGANWQFMVIVPECDMILLFLSSRSTYGQPQADIIGLLKRLLREAPFKD